MQYSARRRGAVAVGMAVLWGLCAATAPGWAARTPLQYPRAPDIVVANCNDSGAGSLREAIARARSGDLLSMEALSCTGIALTTGALRVTQDDLALLGPGIAFTIDGNRAGRILSHTGFGALSVEGLSIANGRHVARDARGGCIYSDGELVLRRVQVHDCSALGTPNEGALGGAIYAAAGVALAQGSVFASTVAVNGPLVAGVRVNGGGILTEGRLTLIDSFIHHNRAGSMGGGAGARIVHAHQARISDNVAADAGGFYTVGFFALASTSIVNSLIAGNRATGEAGGALFGRGRTQVVNTTVSGNSAARISALAIGDAAAVIANSTIAFNRETTAGAACAGAIHWSSETSEPMYVESTIIAGNTCASRPSNIEADPGQSLFEGANNLIRSSTVPVPRDTISAVPRLGLLAANGGRWPTHALLPESPAIDRGRNSSQLVFDGRGPGFRRVMGRAPDIGAFER